VRVFTLHLIWLFNILTTPEAIYEINQDMAWIIEIYGLREI